MCAEVSTSVVWVLEGERRGDNAQALELASRLSACIEIKPLRYNRLCRWPNFLLGAGLASVSSGAENLRGPWPDLVIGIGRRSVPVARWIKKQSGGRTRLVQIGRPRARPEIFDLVITTPQYGVPIAPNVIELQLPIVPQRILEKSTLEFWQREFCGLAKPLIAVLIGGPAKPFQMNEQDLIGLIGEAERLKERLSGSTVLLASPRTPHGMLEKSAEAFGSESRLFPWGANRSNPYTALLELADRYVVTSDSVTMITETLHTGKPVDLFMLREEKRFRLPLDTWPFSWLARRGLLVTPRDVSKLTSSLIAKRQVGILGENLLADRNPSSMDDKDIAAIIEGMLRHSRS